MALYKITLTELVSYSYEVYAEAKSEREAEEWASAIPHAETVGTLVCSTHTDGFVEDIEKLDYAPKIITVHTVP